MSYFCDSNYFPNKMDLPKCNQSECFQTSFPVDANQMDCLSSRKGWILHRFPSEERSKSPLVTLAVYHGSVWIPFSSEWSVLCCQGYSIIDNKYSSACIVHLSCMTDELQLQKWMENPRRQMSPFSAGLTDKLHLDLNKVSNFMLSDLCPI